MNYVINELIRGYTRIPAMDEKQEYVTVILDCDAESGYFYYPAGPGGSGLRNGRGIGCAITREQYERWRVADEAYLAVQEEIRGYIEADPYGLPGRVTKYVVVHLGDSGVPYAASSPHNERMAKWVQKILGGVVVPLSD